MNSQNPEKLLNYFKDQEVIVICIAAKNENYESVYLNLAQTLEHLSSRLTSLKQLIVISSTSVYEESNGSIIDENSPLNLKDHNPHLLVETENYYLRLKNKCKVVIFRLGEIYGKKRNFKEKLTQLQEREVPGDGLKKVNASHILDIVMAIRWAIEHKKEGIFNLVASEHPTRKQLYEKISNKYGLKLPLFNPNLYSYHGKNKEVSNEKIKKEGFKLKFPQIEI
ncbi:MAG: NAD-dependent epimerase/dehydratase family protein [Chlamydiae bacterium]|nr:NAD-dependent epimerase/dehydratase family protein [Chlamydiota bacterium]